MRIFAIAAWCLTFFLAAHESSEPTIAARWSPGWAFLIGLSATVAASISILCRPRPLYWLYRTRFQLGVLAIMGPTALAMMEGVVRVFDLLGISYYEESKRYHLEKLADEDLVYAHRPNWSTHYQSVAVRFNELGFRDDPIAPKAMGELRILFLGDSVTFGWGVAQDSIFAARLEHILSTDPERPVVVVNTGVGSYNTVQQRAVLERYGERLAPDIVLLLYVYNDVGVHQRPFDPHAQFELANYNAAGKISVILGRSWLYRLVRHVRSTLGPQSMPGELPASERPAGWIASMGALDDIAGWARTRKVPFATYVWRRSADDRDRLWSDLLATGRRGGFPVVEAAPAWVDVTTHRLSVVDSHPNARGHALLAQAIADDLHERGWLRRPR